MEGVACVNLTGCSNCVNAGGRGVEAETIKGSEPDMMLAEPNGGKLPTVRSVQSVADQEKKLLNLINRPTLLDKKQTQELLDLISDHHAAFNLDDCLTWRFTQGMKHQGELPHVICCLLSGMK